MRLHSALRDQAGGRRILAVPLAEGATIRELLDLLAEQFPAVERRIRDETGTLRRHVNLFVDAEHVRGLGGLDHRLHDGAEILVLPAVSGGAHLDLRSAGGAGDTAQTLASCRRIVVDRDHKARDRPHDPPAAR